MILLASFSRVDISGKEKIARTVIHHHIEPPVALRHPGPGHLARRAVSLDNKKGALKAPLFGYALYAARNIFIDRRNTESARDSIRKGLERLPAGASVMFFAEGTRSADGRLGEFKKGGFAVALENGFPILPVTVNGSRKVLPKGGLEFHPGRIGVTVGDPIETAGRDHSAISTLIAETRRTIQSNLSV